MGYKQFPVVDSHIHIHTNEDPASRVAFYRNEEIVNEIFEKTEDDAITLVATGYAGDYRFETSGPVNLPETVVGYYLKDKMPRKIYLFGALPRNYHRPEWQASTRTDRALDGAFMHDLNLYVR